MPNTQVDQSLSDAGALVRDASVKVLHDKAPSVLEESEETKAGLAQIYSEDWDESLLQGLSNDTIRLTKYRVYHINRNLKKAGGSIKQMMYLLAELRNSLSYGTAKDAWKKICSSPYLNINAKAAAEYANAYTKWLEKEDYIPDEVLACMSSRTLQKVANIKDSDIKNELTILLRSGAKLTEKDVNDRLNALDTSTSKKSKEKDEAQKALEAHDEKIATIKKDAKTTDNQKKVSLLLVNAEYKKEQIIKKQAELKSQLSKITASVETFEAASKSADTANAYMQKLEDARKAIKEKQKSEKALMKEIAEGQVPETIESEFENQRVAHEMMKADPDAE